MGGFRIKYNGHGRNARKAVVKLGLAKEEELPYMTDAEVANIINKSNYIVVDEGEDWLLIPEELADKITWINR